MDTLLKERNWLIHKIVDDFYDNSKYEITLNRVYKIAHLAHKTQCMIEDDIIKTAEDNRIDTS